MKPLDSAVPGMINKRGLVIRIILLLLLLTAPSLTACDKKGSDNSKSEVKPIASSQTEMVNVPAGEFIMGSDKEDVENLRVQFGFVRALYKDEHPRHKVKLPPFWIDKYEVTNSDYMIYVTKTHAPEPQVWIQSAYNVSNERLSSFDLIRLRQISSDYFQLDLDTTKMTKEKLIVEMVKKQRTMDRLPISAVTWYEAKAYCEWRGARLPTEAEWEKSARGEEGREFPWGNEWDSKILNTGDNIDSDQGVVSVGSFPKNISPYGALDMAGNVAEWVEDWYKPYTGNKEPDKDFGELFKVTRGGGGATGHYSLSLFFRTALRAPAKPDEVNEDIGFRCAKSEKNVE